MQSYYVERSLDGRNWHALPPVREPELVDRVAEGAEYRYRVRRHQSAPPEEARVERLKPHLLLVTWEP